MAPYGLVYGLYDPLTDELRYVGQTTLPLDRRLSTHLSPKNLSRRRHSSCWLRHLVSRGLKPQIRPLGSAASRGELDALETKVILEAREKGYRLTNHTDGGRGMAGYTLGVETRKKMSESRQGHSVSDQTRAKISKARKGWRPNEEMLRTWGAERRPASTLQLIENLEAFEGTPDPCRSGIPTSLILKKLGEGKTRAQVAIELGISVPLIALRLRKAKNHG